MTPSHARCFRAAATGRPPWPGLRAEAPISRRAELVAAARKEGRCVMYTASFTEPEQEFTEFFNKRFPFVQDRAGARVRRPADHPCTDRGGGRQAGRRYRGPLGPSADEAVSDIFQDYAPPNAADYLESARISPEVVAEDHAHLVHRLQHGDDQDAAEELDGPHEAGRLRAGVDRQRRSLRRAARPGHESCSSARRSIRTTGRSRPRPSRALYPPARRALGRGRARRGADHADRRERDLSEAPGRRAGRIVFPTEGIPLAPYASGIPKTAANPNAGAALPRLLHVQRGPGRSRWRSKAI